MKNESQEMRHLPVTAQEAVTRQHWETLQLRRVFTNLIGELDDATLQAIQAKVTWQHFHSGDVLIHQGDVADAMYLIVSGRVQFVMADGSIVGGAGIGETVGEFGLLATGVRSASVQALRDTSVIILSKTAFEALIDKYPRLLYGITQVIVKRRQRGLGLLPSKQHAHSISITLIPTHPTTDNRAFALQLSAAMQTYGDTLILDSATFEAQAGLSAQLTLDDPNNLAVVRWLDEQESHYKHLIFIPDAAWTEWTRRCVSQSDRVLMLADRRESAELGSLEQQVQTAFPHTRRDLVMWHPADTDQPSKTARWLEKRDVRTYYHVRDGDVTHFGRMVRRLTSRAIGLTLAGGGARGFVHLGVFKALEECGIPIDYVGGASFGALMAVNKARELSAAQILAASEDTSKGELLFDRTLPFVALNSSAKITRICKALFDDLQIEDLWIPYFAIVTNLTQHRMEVVEQGPVWSAIRKSVSIPGVFMPVIEDGDQFVDGGVVNNFPVDVLKERAESSRLIGVRCTPNVGKKYTYDVETSVSGWHVLARQLNPFTKRLRTPRIADTLMRSVVVNSSRLAEQNEALCDLYLDLGPRGFGFLDFDSFREISDFGFEHSLAPLQAWAAVQADL